MEVAGEGDVVVAGQGDVTGDVEAGLVEGGQGARRDHVGGRDHGGEVQTVLEGPAHQAMTGVTGEVAVEDQRGVGIQPPGPVRRETAALTALGGGVVRPAAEEQHASVALGQDMGHERVGRAHRIHPAEHPRDRRRRHPGPRRHVPDRAPVRVLALPGHASPPCEQRPVPELAGEEGQD
ncbi:hypothetical protein TUSST3_04310 [Streptomyces sp. TUS-ST3]|nr:hypothetical protein TUSST3_04310 [Streptomyces sp. TUS-ST3]